MPYAQMGGARLHYEYLRAGSTEDQTPLLFMMGHGADYEGWRPQIDYFRGKRDLIVYDHRGVGRSGRPRYPDYGMATLADDAAELLGAVGAPRAHVVGISMGSLVAQQLAIRHPDRVSSLALASSFARASRDLSRVVAGVVGKAAYELVRTTFRGDDALERQTDAVVHAWGPAAFSDRFLAENGPLVRSEVRRTLQVNRRLDVALMQIIAVIRYDARAELARIHAPTWIVAGSLDRHVPVALAEELAAGIAGSRLDVWEVGHSLTLEAADRFNERLAAFVEGVEDPSRRSSCVRGAPTVS